VVSKYPSALQRRLRRDREFRIASFAGAKATLGSGLPSGIDDLKALVMDRLETLQEYIRGSGPRSCAANCRAAQARSFLLGDWPLPLHRRLEEEQAKIPKTTGMMLAAITARLINKCRLTAPAAPSTTG
jgi:hypothetical protein